MKPKNYIGILILLIFVCFSVYTRFTNIDMTGARLLVTFWWQYMVLTVIALFGIVLLYD